MAAGRVAGTVHSRQRQAVYVGSGYGSGMAAGVFAHRSRAGRSPQAA